VIDFAQQNQFPMMFRNLFQFRSGSPCRWRLSLRLPLHCDYHYTMANTEQQELSPCKRPNS
jgi:hypothetical protein